MKIRKSVLKQDLKNMPIDHGDMFLMSQAEDLIEVDEVAELMPWEAAETQRRLAALVKLGLLEWVNERGESVDRPHPDTQPNFYVAVTLRPKPSKTVSDLFRQTESSVVALRTPEGLVLLDRAEVHNDRSVFSRATIVREKAVERSAPSRPATPVAQAQRSEFPTTPAPRPSHLDEAMRIALPPLLGGKLPGLPALASLAGSGATPREAIEALVLPPFAGDTRQDLPLAPPSTFAPFATEELMTCSPPLLFEPVGSTPAPRPASVAPNPRQARPAAATVGSRAALLGSDPRMRGAPTVEVPRARGLLDRATAVDLEAESRSAAFEQTLSQSERRQRRR